MTKPTEDRYLLDPSDGLRVEEIGEWASEKHERLRKYIDICHRARSKYPNAGTTYIDLYCGPGRARCREGGANTDGSPLLAFNQANKRTPFSEVHIGDADSTNLNACASRLAAAGCLNVVTYEGNASDTAKEVVARLHPHGLHLAFLDPYSIVALPFSVIRDLAAIERMDLIIHVSIMDLQRNLREYERNGRLSDFAPGWEAAVDTRQKDEIVRIGIFNHWCKLLEDLGYFVGAAERVNGNKNQPLYWLVGAAKHELGKRFWHEIRQVQPQRQLGF